MRSIRRAITTIEITSNLSKANTLNKPEGRLPLHRFSKIDLPISFSLNGLDPTNNNNPQLRDRLLKENLDFTQIKENVQMAITKTIPNSKEQIHLKEEIENTYRQNLIISLRQLDDLIERKNKCQNEINSYQNEILLLKSKIKSSNESLNSLKSTTSKQSMALFQKFVTERNAITRRIQEYKNRIKIIENVLTFKTEKLKTMTVEIKKQKSSKEKKISHLIHYYCGLISEGSDIRFEGLSWILYKLSELGFDVRRCQYPSHINKKDFEYLVDIAQLKIEIEKYKIVYKAIRAKFSKGKKTKKIQNNFPEISENSRTTFYEKFLKNYLEDKNALIHANRRDPDNDAKVSDFYNQMFNVNMPCMEASLKNKNDNKDEITKEIIDEVSEIKKGYEQCVNELSKMQKEKVAAFKKENEDLKLSNFAEYEKIFQSIFGLFAPVS